MRIKIRRRISIRSWAAFVAGLTAVAVCFLDAPGQDAKVRGRTRNPHGTSEIACTACHTSLSWTPLRPSPDFDHSRTSYPLRGLHKGVDCRKCHVSLVFKEATKECARCHADLHRKQFGARCEDCHSPSGWRISVQALEAHKNRFPLIEGHSGVDCESCHTGGPTQQYVGLSTGCLTCHASEFRSTRVVNHQAFKASDDCRACHSLSNWAAPRFDHGATGFPLTGGHSGLNCSSCHSAGGFGKVNSQCATCHLKDFNATSKPNHQSAGFTVDCASCHGTSAWTDVHFDHSKTPFPLTGGHAKVDCAKCHASTWVGTSSDCVSCHLADYRQARNPNHVTVAIPQNCASCHTTAGWSGASFDHDNLTKFPITGAHKTATCLQCHANGQYGATSGECVACHLKDFNSAKNPNHAADGFPQTCASCHDTSQWQGAKFDHSLTKFPLTGGHASVTCVNCHANGHYAGTSLLCDGCHLDDYKSVKDPNHVAAGFERDCSICHSTVDWKGGTFDHDTRTKFPLTGAHKPATCLQCHTNEMFKGTASECVACHLDDYNSSKEPNHVAAGLSRDCATCHSTTEWRGAKFDHSTTKFPLTGGHVKAECSSCHVSGQYAGTSMLCEACHMNDFNTAKEPNHVTAGFPHDCSTCHNTTVWTGATFNHDTLTKFPLTGGHTTASCAQCHANNLFKGTASQCVACHLTNYNSTKNPNHVAAGLSQDCVLCHDTTQWTGAKFDHSTTKFPLTGAHKTAGCTSCHVNGPYAGTSALCESCHLKDFNTAANPNHVTAGFPHDCSTCHTTAAWAGATFNHDTLTKFPLTGSHKTATCAQCHANNLFKGTASQCVACHLTNYNSTKNPNHVAAGLSQDCVLCHDTTQWTGAKFDHSATKFPLTGAHKTAGCTSCHVNGPYAGTSALCESCHLKDFNTATNPNHVTAGFPHDCSVCHTTTAWAGATFNHDTLTKFPLTGSHKTATCAQCHANNVFKGTASQCVACHLTNYNSTKNPNHVAAGFSQDCVLCHDTTQWLGAKFDHSTTKFPLTGAHKTTGCASCHSNGQYAGTSMLCESCHLKDFNTATNPNHVTAGFPHDCSVCHTTTAWAGATFNHDTLTKFPLTGAHKTTSCTSCHSDGQYSGTSMLCESCHLKDFNSATNPNHVTAGFPHDCSACHSTTSWSGASFNHASTQFPLTGAHTTVTCIKCHVNNQFTGLDTRCVACHLQQYKATTNPNHVSAGFPQDCQVCHQTTAWTPASFNHSTTAFPLTGKHTTTPCASCHIAGVYKGTPQDCYSCHKSEYQTVTNPNHIAAGFPQACGTCHNTTTWSGATFSHKFPIYSGAHANRWNACQDCHSNPSNYAVFTCFTCHEHNQTSMDSKHHDVQNYVYNSANCYTCHPQGRAD